MKIFGSTMCAEKMVRMQQSSNRAVLLKIDGREFGNPLKRIFATLDGRMDANLSHVCVSTILVIRYDCNLYHKRSNRLITDIFHWYLDPTCVKVRETITFFVLLSTEIRCDTCLSVRTDRQFQFPANH